MPKAEQINAHAFDDFGCELQWVALKEGFDIDKYYGFAAQVPWPVARNHLKRWCIGTCFNWWCLHVLNLVIYYSSTFKVCRKGQFKLNVIRFTALDLRHPETRSLQSIGLQEHSKYIKVLS